MRRSIALTIATSAFVPLLCGCVDFFGNDRQDHIGGTPSGGNPVAVAVTGPSRDVAVPESSNVSITWSASNSSGTPGTATVSVESLNSLASTPIAAGLPVNGSTGRVTTQWNTDGFERGPYRVRVSVTAGTITRESTAAGIVTLDAAPFFEFTAPLTDQTLPEEDALEIKFNGFDLENEGVVTLFADPGDTATEDDRVQISNEIQLNDDPADDELNFDWNGNDSGNRRVAVGTYSIIAVVSDPGNPDQTFIAPGRVTVPEPPDNTDEGLGFDEPSEDTTFLRTDDTLLLRLRVERSVESLVDVGIDTDDVHTNGNELTILSQRFIPENTPTSDLEWDGSDDDGNDVPDGIYRLFLVSSAETGTPTVQPSEILVFRRSDAEQPLIGLLQPSSVQSVTPGSFLNIRWRDDDPTGEALIRITVDDDPNPAEGTETDDPEVEILTSRAAEPDGVQDTFSWRVPSTLPFGNYYVFAYIDADPSTTQADHVSVSPVVFRVIDPADPDM